MSETVQLRSPSRQIFRNNIRSRKRRAPAEECNPCTQHYARGLTYPQTDSGCGAAAVTAPRAQVKNFVVSEPRQATGCLSAYQVGGKMGSGNYGVVFKARHSPTNDWVAIKCLGSDPDGEGIPSTTLRELSLLRDLNHPNIIRYLNLFFY